jgi:hypothetical protein
MWLTTIHAGLREAVYRVDGAKFIHGEYRRIRRSSRSVS